MDHFITCFVAIVILIAVPVIILFVPATIIFRAIDLLTFVLVVVIYARLDRVEGRQVGKRYFLNQPRRHGDG